MLQTLKTLTVKSCQKGGRNILDFQISKFSIGTEKFLRKAKTAILSGKYKKDRRLAEVDQKK